MRLRLTTRGDTIKSIIIALLCLAGIAQAETITLVPNTSNSNYTPSAAEMVTVGIPFAPCTMTDPTDFRLLDGAGAEVPVFVKQTLYWPDTKVCGVESTRSVKVQFAMDATGGEKIYSWDLAGRTVANDLSEQPVREVESSLANRAGYNEPVVFGILPPEYVTQAQLTAPTAPMGDNTFDNKYYPAKFDYAVVNGINFVTPGTSDWLLDTTSAIYKQAMRRGEVEQYRQAYLNHEFHVDHIVTTYVQNGNSCPGGWAIGTGHCGDAKQLYTEPQKLHIALTGDDTWRPKVTEIGSTLHEIINHTADLLFDGSSRTAYKGTGLVWPAGFRTEYVNRDQAYTERHAGIGLISILNACQITHDAEICGHLNTAIDNIYSHNIDENNVWRTPYAGYQKHSWMKHENTQQPWVGLAGAAVDSNTFTLTGTLGAPDEVVAGTGVEIRTEVTLSAPLHTYTHNPTTGAIVDALVTVDEAVGLNVTPTSYFHVGGKSSGRIMPLSPAQPNTFRIYGKPAAIGWESFKAGDKLIIFQVNYPVTSIADSGDNTWTVDTTLDPANILADTVVKAPRNTYFPDTDEGFSPWMSDILLDGLWQYYHWSDDEIRKTKAAHVILGIARATVAFSIDGTNTQPATIAAIEAAFSDWPTEDGIDIIAGIPDYEVKGAKLAPLSRYAGSYWMAQPGASKSSIANMSEGGYQKQHLPELIHTMAVGIYFETDQAKKAAMQLVADQSMAWFDSYETSVPRGAIRSYPWQLRSDPYGTYQFALANSAGTTVELPSVDPVQPPVEVLPPDEPPAEAPDVSRSVSVTAVGSGYWRVMSGEVQVSQHTAERESIESAVNAVLANPGAGITIRHDATYTVTKNPR